MEKCAFILACGGVKSPALVPVLFRPSLAWVVDCARAAGVEDIRVWADSDDFAADVDVELISGTRLRDFAAAHSEVLVLRGDIPLLSSRLVADALTAHLDEQRAVTAIEGAGAYWFSSKALVSAMSGSDFSFDGAAKSLASPGSAISADGDSVLSTGDTASLAEINLRARLGVINRLLASGVSIPCADGLMISPEAQIAPGTVIMPMTVIKGKSSVGSGCVIGANTVVDNCVIGENVKLDNVQCLCSEIRSGAELGPFVRVRPGSVIGENVHIGNFVEVKNSTIGESTSLSHLSYVGDADIGCGVNFGCGFATANYNGSKKFRTHVGDGAFIGCDNTLVAPVSVGNGAYTAAGSVITEDVPDGALAVARSRQTVKENWASEKGLYKKKQRH